jgi:hypothetical protein
LLLDMQAKAPGAPAYDPDNPKVLLYPSEADWIASATKFADDIVFVAPTGDAAGGAAAYPAALSPGAGGGAGRLLAVGAVDCAGKRWPAGPAARADLLAPGVDIAGAGPSGAGPAATLAPSSGGPPAQLAVAAGGAASGRAETTVPLVACKADGSCPSGGAAAKAACVLPAKRDNAGRLACEALTSGACGGGVVVVPADKSGGLSLELVRMDVDSCAPRAAMAAAAAAAGGGGAGGAPASHPPVLVATSDAEGGRLLDAARAQGAAGRLLVNRAPKAVTTGTSEAAAWVAGGAARLMARYPMCPASAVVDALIDTAALLGPDGAPTGKRGRGGLVQLADAEQQLGGKECAGKKLPVPSTAGASRMLSLLSHGDSPLGK